MTDPRTVVIGMNNPHSARPDAALLPYPRGVAGHRLWAMVSEVCGVSRHEWCRLTDRRNLVDDTTWDARTARTTAAALLDELQGRRVVALGGSVAAALWLPATTPGTWTPWRGMMLCRIPHPSGLCRDYNDPLARIAVGLLFEEELDRTRRALETPCAIPAPSV